MAKLKIKKRARKPTRTPAPVIEARTRRRARRNPTSVVTSSGSSSGLGSEWLQVGAAGGAYVGGRVTGNIGGALGNKWKGNRRGGKVLAAGALIALAYYLPRKFPQLRKYRTAMLTGAVIAFVQSVIEEFAPKLGTLLGFKLPQLAAPQAAAAVAQIQAEQRRIYANRTTVAHPDDAMYDRIEAQQFTQPAPQAQQYVPAQPAPAPQGQGDDSGFEFEDEEVDYGQGAGGIFTVE